MTIEALPVRVVRALLLAASVAAVAGVPPIRAQSIDLEKALARPASPGAIALLGEGASDPRVRQRLVSALGDARAEVRAAAARVVNASGTVALLPDVTEALAKETDRGAAIEMIRAVANLGDAATDPVLLEASTRLDLGAVAGPAFAAGRGAPALAALESFRAADPDGRDTFPLKDVLRLASRGDRDLLGPVVTKAFREQDVALWAAYLELTRDMKMSVPGGMLSFALSSERFRVETLWYVLVSAVEPPDVQAQVNELLATRDEATDVEDQFLRELLARRKGDKPRENRAWIGRRSASEETKLSGVGGSSTNGVLLLLTKNERRALSAQTMGDAKWLDKEMKHEKQEARSRASTSGPRAAAGATGTLRTVAGFPPGFVSDLLGVTDCHPRALLGIANASVLFSLAGRPRQVTIAVEPGAAGVPPGCVEAARALILDSLLDPHDLSTIAHRDRLLVLLEPDFLTCLADPIAGTLQSSDVGKGQELEPPKKVSDVAPDYPGSALREGVQGTTLLESVVTKSGCVQRLSVLESPDDRLSLAAIEAVSRWRFRPARLGGAAVPIVMTVTVNFMR